MALNIDRTNLNSESLPAAPKEDRRTWWMTLFLLCAVLGAMLGLSFKTQTVKQQQAKLEQSQGSDMLIKSNTDLQRRIAQLQSDNAQLAKSAPSDTARLKLISKDLAQAQFLACLTDVKGPGIIVTLDDSHKPAGDLPPGYLPPNIIHDADISTVLNELKSSGAEAISVNDQRISAVTPVRCVGPTIMINFTPQAPPYVIKAIGDPKTLKTGMNLAQSGGAIKEMISYDPAMFAIQPAKQPLLIPAYAGGNEPKFARPVSGQVADASKKA